MKPTKVKELKTGIDPRGMDISVLTVVEHGDDTGKRGVSLRAICRYIMRGYVNYDEGYRSVCISDSLDRLVAQGRIVLQGYRYVPAAEPGSWNITCNDCIYRHECAPYPALRCPDCHSFNIESH